MVSNFRGCCPRVVLCRHPWVDPDWTRHGAWLLGSALDGAYTGPCLGLSSDEQWLVQGPVLLLDSLLLGLNPLQPALLNAVFTPGLARYGGALAGPAKAQVLCLPVAFLCLNPVLLPAMWEIAPGLFVSSPALGPFLWGDADSLLGRLRDLWLGLPGRFGLCLLWRRREVCGVSESMLSPCSVGVPEGVELGHNAQVCMRYYDDLHIIFLETTVRILKNESWMPWLRTQVGGIDFGGEIRNGFHIGGNSQFCPAIVSRAAAKTYHCGAVKLYHRDNA